MRISTFWRFVIVLLGQEDYRIYNLVQDNSEVSSDVVGIPSVHQDRLRIADAGEHL